MFIIFSSFSKEEEIFKCSYVRGWDHVPSSTSGASEPRENFILASQGGNESQKLHITLSVGQFIIPNNKYVAMKVKNCTLQVGQFITLITQKSVNAITLMTNGDKII